MKVGNWHGWDPLEGRRGQADASAGGNMAVHGDRENHVHRTSSNIRDGSFEGNKTATGDGPFTT
jgi:hypothetical protein